MPPGIVNVRALYDYEADSTTSISFRKGDVIQAIEQLDSGWWYGDISGVCGWFPGNHCQILSGPEELADQIQISHLDQGVSEGEDGAVSDQSLDRQDNESEGDAQGALPTVLSQGSDAPPAAQRTGLSLSPPFAMISHEPPRTETAKQDDYKGAGDPPALQDLPEMVRDFRLETETVFEITVHVMHGIHGQRRQAWKWEQVLGWGGGGFVRLQSCLNGPDEGRDLRAVKCLQLKKSSKFIHYSRELETLIKFSHSKYSDFFVSCYGWFSEKDRLYIALEYLPLGDLNEHLEAEKTTLSAAEAKQVVRQVATALSFMHDAGFAHRDLKPKNVLIKTRPPQEWWVKLSDFGLSKRLESEHESSVLMGTYAYAAPELLSHPGRNSSKADCSSTLNWPAADMWSLGQLICRVVTGRLAFENDDLRNYSQGKCEFPSQIFSESDDSLQLGDFVSSVMRVDPESRLKIGGALHHSWLRPEGHQMATRSNDFCTAASSTGHEIRPRDTTEFCNETAHSIYEIRPWDTTDLRNGAADTTQDINHGFTTELQNETVTIRPQRVSETVQPRVTTVGECADVVSPPSRVVPTDPEDVQFSPEPPCEVFYIHGRTGGSRSSDMHQFAELDTEPLRRYSPLLIHENASAKLGEKRQGKYMHVLSIIQAAEYDGNIALQPLELARIQINKGLVTALALSSDASKLAVACAQSLQLWATDPPACICNLQVMQGDLKNVHFSPDSKWICGSVHKLALLFDVMSGLRMTVLVKHHAVIQSLNFTQDSQYLFSVSQNGDLCKSSIQDGPENATKFKSKLGGFFAFPTTPILSWLQQDSQGGKEDHTTLCQNGRMFEWHPYSHQRRPHFTGRKMDWYGSEAILPKTFYWTTISPNKTIIALLHSKGLTLLPGDLADAVQPEMRDWEIEHWNSQEAQRTRAIKFLAEATMFVRARKGIFRSDAIQNIEFLADSTMLSVSLQNGSIELWNLLSGRTIAKSREDDTQASCMATSLNSYTLATVSNSVDVVLWDTEACKTMDEVLSHIGSATFIAVSHDNGWLLSIPYSTTTKETFCLWNVQEASIAHIFSAPQDTTTLLARFTHESEQLLCLSRDCTLSTLDVSTGKSLKTQRLSIKGIASRYLTDKKVLPSSKPFSISLTCYAADMSPDLSVVAGLVVVEDYRDQCAICLWDVESGRQIGFFGWVPVLPGSSLFNASSPIIGDLETLELTFSSDAKQLAAMFGTYITVYDTDTGAKVSELSLRPLSARKLQDESDTGHRSDIKPSNERNPRACLNRFEQTLSFSPDGHELSILTRSNNLFVWSLDTMRIDSFSRQRRLFPPTSTFSGQEFIYPVMSRDWKYRALPTHYGTLAVHNRENVLLREIQIPSGDMKLLAFSPDSKLLVVMSSTRFTVWDIAMNDMWQVIHDGPVLTSMEDVESVFVSSSPATLFAATSNSLVCVWDLGTGACIKQYQGRPGIRHQTHIPWAASMSRRRGSGCTQFRVTGSGSFEICRI